MKRNMTGTIIALSLLLAAGLSTGCDRAKDQVLPDAKSVVTTKSAPQSNPFQGVQDDADGYNQHQWDQSVDEFRTSFVQNRQKTSPEFNETSFKSDFQKLGSGMASDPDYLGYFTGIAMYVLEEVPSASAELVIPAKGYFPDQRFMPTEMSAFYDRTDKVYYFFHKDRLAFVSVSVESNPNQALKSKYPLVSSTQFQTGDRLDGRYDVELFKRGTTNTRIYNIYYAQDDSPLRSRFLIYIPSTILYQLQAEVTATVAAAREQERKANQALQQATTRRVQ